jgi:hypothetical protein
MEKILRPVFRLNAVVTKRPNDLELHRPPLRHQNVGHTLGFDSGVSVAVVLRGMLGNERFKPRFPVRARAGLELFERNAASIYGEDGGGDVVNELLH